MVPCPGSHKHLSLTIPLTFFYGKNGNKPGNVVTVLVVTVALMSWWLCFCSHGRHPVSRRTLRTRQVLDLIIQQSDSATTREKGVLWPGCASLSPPTDLLSPGQHRGLLLPPRHPTQVSAGQRCHGVLSFSYSQEYTITAHHFLKDIQLQCLTTPNAKVFSV